MDAAHLLDWHQSRRRKGTPTLSVLVGPVGPGVRAWRRWAGERPVAQVMTGDLMSIVHAWLTAAFEVASPGELARAWIHSLIGTCPPLRTQHDLDELWRTLPIDPTSPTAIVARRLLAAAIDGQLSDLLNTSEPTAVLAGVCGLLPEDRRPALLLTPCSGSDWFPAAVRFLESVTTAVPALPVAVSVSDTEFAAIQSDDPSRFAALAREGRVPVSAVSEQELSERLTAAGVDPPPPPTTLAALTVDGLTAEAAEAFVAVAAAARTPDGCRSEAERFLLAQLEAMPETAGLFRPNRTLPFRHGNKAAEADLLAERLNLVVEVDGAYYHLTRDQYARDRRKDWLYQRHGYLVLRFLAENVVTDLAEILTTVVEAVRFRRPPNEVPPRD